jgi:hypothetical protein
MKTSVLQENIIKLLGLENLPEDQKQKLLEQMSGVVQSRITRRVDAIFSAEQKDQFNKLTESGANDEQIGNFLKITVPNFDNIATEEIIKFKEEMAQEAQTVKEALK